MKVRQCGEDEDTKAPKGIPGQPPVRRPPGQSHGQGKKEGGPWGPMDTLRQDLRYALRTLSRSPGFVAVTILSLTFAIAVSTLVFSVANAGLFRPVPYVADQDALVRVFTGNQRNHGRGPNSFPDFQDYQDLSGTMEELAELATELRHHGISLVLDFVFNHTSDEHRWALAAQAGSPVSMKPLTSSRRPAWMRWLTRSR